MKIPFEFIGKSLMPAAIVVLAFSLMNVANTVRLVKNDLMPRIDAVRGDVAGVRSDIAGVRGDVERLKHDAPQIAGDAGKAAGAGAVNGAADAAKSQVMPIIVGVPPMPKETAPVVKILVNPLSVFHW
jgi:hypothetical protein